MKKMIVLSFVLMGVFEAGVLGNGTTPAELVKKWSPLSFSEKDLTKSIEEGDMKDKFPVIENLKKAYEKFHCAFTVQDNIKQKYDFTTVLRRIGMGSVTDGARALVRGHSTRAIKDFSDEGSEGRKIFNLVSQDICPSGEIIFDQGWSPLKYSAPADPKKPLTLENFVRSLKFDVETKEDGTPLDGKNIKSGAFYALTGRKVTLGWFGLAPLKDNIKKRNTYRTNRKDKTWHEGIAEMVGLLDCNASGFICDRADNFFRRLKGCSMRSLYQSGGFGGCIQVAAKSDWVKKIVTSGVTINEVDLTGAGSDRGDAEKAEAKIAHQIIWTFVLAELLERHDARRYRNNVVRGLTAELENKKEEKFIEVLKFLKEVQTELLKTKNVSQILEATGSSEQVKVQIDPKKQAKIKREISLAFESVYDKQTSAEAN